MVRIVSDPGIIKHRIEKNETNFHPKVAFPFQIISIANMSIIQEKSFHTLERSYRQEVEETQLIYTGRSRVHPGQKQTNNRKEKLLSSLLKFHAGPLLPVLSHSSSLGSSASSVVGVGPAGFGAGPCTGRRNTPRAIWHTRRCRMWDRWWRRHDTDLRLRRGEGRGRHAARWSGRSCHCGLLLSSYLLGL